VNADVLEEVQRTIRQIFDDPINLSTRAMEAVEIGLNGDQPKIANLFWAIGKSSPAIFHALLCHGLDLNILKEPGLTVRESSDTLSPNQDQHLEDSTV
jgi:hypothetical protein